MDDKKKQELEKLCSEVRWGDGIDPKLEMFHKKIKNRKALQLCAQVADTLNCALAGCADEVLQGLTVASVVPAPNAGRMLVTLVGDGNPDELLLHVDRANGILRTEIGSVINRKKVPLLTFTIAPKEDGSATQYLSDEPRQEPQEAP